MQIYYIIAIVIAAVVALLFILALLCDFAAFGKRCDINPALKYFSAEHFGLSAREVEVSRGIKGFIYRGNCAQNGKVLVFCHGLGPGHVAYMTEIAYFCGLGYTVLAADSRGCNYSDGKNLKGMYSGAKTVMRAVDFVRRNEELFSESAAERPKIYLVGHSWGGYSALAASARRKVEGVVAISAPVSPSKTVSFAAARIITKPPAVILTPFLAFINFIKFGAAGNANAAKCAKINSAPTLLVHGDNDYIVPVGLSAFGKAEGENITKYCVKGKAHNPYNTQNAERLLAELYAQLKKGVKDFSAFDFKAATEEDAEVMDYIARFLENN